MTTLAQAVDAEYSGIHGTRREEQVIWLGQGRYRRVRPIEAGTPRQPVRGIGFMDSLEDERPAKPRKRNVTSNYAEVVACVQANPGITYQEIADQVGIGYDAAQRHCVNASDAGVIRRERVGRGVGARAPWRCWSV